MNRIDIREVGKYGVVLDYPFHELPPAVWTDLRNVRAKDGSMSPIGGETEYFTENSPVTNPWNVFYCPTISGAPYWVYGGTDKVCVTSSTTDHTDITPVATTLTADDQNRWTGQWLNGVFLMNSFNEELLVWDEIDPVTPVPMKRMSDITDTEYQDTWRFKSVRAFKEILIGIGFEDNGVSYPTVVKWSGPAAAGQVPIAWDEANLNNIAGEQPLSVTPGAALDGQQLGDYFILCKEDATILASFSQGASALNFKYIDNTSGVLAINCMVEYLKGQMLILNQNFDVVVTEGTQVTSILTDRLRESLQSRVNSVRRHQAFVVNNPFDQEVWICYPIAGDEDTAGDLCAQEALIWNYQDNTFYFHDLGRLSHVAFGKVVSDGETDFINDIDIIINQVRSTIDSGGAQSIYSMVGASYARDTFFKLDDGLEIDGTPVDAILERKGLALVGQKYPNGEYLVDHQAVKIVTGIWPTFEVSGTLVLLEISVGSQEKRDGPIYWDGPNVYNVDTDQQMDFFVEGIYITVRFSIPYGDDWKLHTYAVELSVAGDVL